jgi:hypothetical protein
MRLWPVLLVYLSQLGQLQLQPQSLLEHPAWPWSASLIGLAMLRTLPWALLSWQLNRLKTPLLLSNCALCLALGWSGFPDSFSGSAWALALLQALTVILWMIRPTPLLVVLAACYWPWHALPCWQALVCGAAWLLAPPSSPWRSLLSLQLLLRLMGAPSLPWEWVALGVLGGATQPRPRLLLIGLLSLGVWERGINKSLLIPLQECHLSLLNLAWPASPLHWAATRGVAYGVTPNDLELARWIGVQPATLIHSPQPKGRLQPKTTQRIVERLSGRSDLGFPQGGESWVSHNLELGRCNYPVRMRGEEKVVPPQPPIEAGAAGQVTWKPLQPVGPGSWVDVEVRGAPTTLMEEPLALTLSPGRYSLQLPVDTCSVRVKGLAQYSLNLETALAGLQLLGCQGPPDLTSNSLTSANVSLRLSGSQSLWVPYLGAQLRRPDLPEGWRETSPLTQVGQLIRPGQEVRLPCWLEVPEMAAAFECDFYWIAPKRREFLLGRARFSCRPRFPAKL